MRFIVTQKLYPSFDEGEVAQLSYHAWQVYENEILPIKEQELADKARELLAEGQSLTRVASKFGMTSGKLERLLARYPVDGDKNQQ
jgi:DNA-binding phage protein